MAAPLFPSPTDDAPPAVRLRGVGKRYDRLTAAGNIFTRFALSRAHTALCSEEFWALRGVDLEIAPGAMVGVIGPNGSGKSTLLKLIGGITPPTEGTVEVRGCVMPMLEVGHGFHEELTGYENVYLHSSILGLSRAATDERLAAIIAFSELGEFMEMPLKHFSSGMHARLGFAIAVHSEADIILIDEVLTVGDVSFQGRCVEAIQRLRAEGRTIFFVTHNFRHAQLLCDQILWFDQGRLVDAGPAEGVAMAHRRALCHEALGRGGDAPRRRAGLTAVRVDRSVIQHGESLTVTVEGEAQEPLLAPDLRFTVVRSDFEIIGVETARDHGECPDRLHGPFTWSIHWPEVFLNTGDCDLSVTLLAEGRPVAESDAPIRFRIEAPHMVDPKVLADLPCRFSLRSG